MRVGKRTLIAWAGVQAALTATVANAVEAEKETEGKKVNPIEDIHIGQFANKEEAEKLTKSLKEQYAEIYGGKEIYAKTKGPKEKFNPKHFQNPSKGQNKHRR